MPRKPFYHTFDGWWYTQLDVGPKRKQVKQVKLVKGKENEQEAYCAFCRLLAEHG